ncbi:hypothetical protein MTR_7g092610 [Medicago truncatula]|uniref:ShKT domain-containing protein n=1 Tax=Medicago truncatula TaxID=3880 RepID=G7KUG4_MEDTR|nr:hypothetical protein MTR_7g092610 [Medicago truncatula]
MKRNVARLLIILPLLWDGGGDYSSCAQGLHLCNSGWVKLNCNRAFKENGNCVGCCGLLQDTNDKCDSKLFINMVTNNCKTSWTTTSLIQRIKNLLDVVDTLRFIILSDKTIEVRLT